MLNQSQAEVMITLQAKMNAKVNPDWINAAYPYLRAVVVEGAEAMEHHGWKWWKKQERDLEQLRMELVDIWHFILSHLLLECRGDEKRTMLTLLKLADAPDTLTFDGKDFAVENLDTIEKLELIIGLSVAGRINLHLFAALLDDCEMTWNDLFCQYVGKNVLNFFRQDHGYKEGSYKKIWNGQEDNEHLVEAMGELDSQSSEFQHLLYASLKDRYQKSE